MLEKICSILKFAGKKIFTGILAVCLFCPSLSYGSSINNLRIGQNTNGYRLVFDADSKFEYKVFLLNEPRRLVIDVDNINVTSSIVSHKDKTGLISAVRVGNLDQVTKRVALDLKTPVVIKKAFMLTPQSKFGWRFVIDIVTVGAREFESKIGSRYAFDSHNKNSASSSKTAQNTQQIHSKAKKIIVLDPGHGGKDPGAIGYSGIYEKNITLAMAKELKAILEKEGRYTVYLTRSTDIFIPLRDRVKIARKYNADLFMSIHADSAVNRNATGLSVYTLSDTASDKEAAALAERENKADIIGGMNLVEHSKEVTDILISLAQRETLNRSSEFAGFMVQEMRKSVKLVDNTHRFAGFAVLKAPDVPSVLLEMGYLSNRTEERQLKQIAYRKKLAVSASNAIRKYFDNMRQASVF